MEPNLRHLIEKTVDWIIEHPEFIKNRFEELNLPVRRFGFLSYYSEDDLKKHATTFAGGILEGIFIAYEELADNKLGTEEYKEFTKLLRRRLEEVNKSIQYMQWDQK